MGIVVPSLFVVAYVLGVFFAARFFLKEKREENISSINKTKSKFEDLEKEKEELYVERIKLQAQATNVFILYEITKDIAIVLHEKEAFKLFEEKLSEHIQFVDCKILKSNDPKIDEYRNNSDYDSFDLNIIEKSMGFLFLKGVSQNEKEKTAILVSQFLLALRRVELYQEIERVAITDSLTDVHTRRYTLDRLSEEISRSKTQKLNLAVLMLDVDHFKKINDNYGHLTGDQVLREIARVIKDSLREIDIAGRFGGEEFCIILPDTDSEGAKFAAERIRKATESTPIKAYDNVINVSVSIGACQFPKDGQKANELIDKSDWALYRAKKQGRNCVCSFGIYDESGEK